MVSITMQKCTLKTWLHHSCSTDKKESKASVVWADSSRTRWMLRQLTTATVVGFIPYWRTVFTVELIELGDGSVHTRGSSIQGF